MLLYIGLFLMVVGVLLFLLIMAINKFEIFAKIGFLIFALGTILGEIGAFAAMCRFNYEILCRIFLCYRTI